MGIACAFPSQSRILGSSSANPMANGAEIKSSSFSSLQGWAMVARSGGRVGHDERRVTKEKIAQLQEVFDENLVIPKECFVRNKEKLLPKMEDK